jgi:hypothetical protein
MLIRFYKSPQPAALIFIPLVALALWFPSFFRDSPSAELTDSIMPFYQPLNTWTDIFPRPVLLVLSVILISIEALWLDRLVSKFEVLYKRSSLAALFYVVLMSLFAETRELHPVILVNGILLLVLDRGFSLYKTETPMRLVFDLGVSLAVASLFYFPCIIIFIGYGLGMILLRPFAWREWMIGFIGFFLPYFYTALYFFWTDRLGYFFSEIIFPHFRLDFTFPFSPGGYQATALVFLAFLFFMSLWTLQSHFYKNVIRTRIYQQLMLIFLLVAGLSFLFAREVYLWHFTLLAIPLATFIAYYFLANKKTWWLEFLFIAFILLWAAGLQ